jgi:hypothetical protein
MWIMADANSTTNQPCIIVQTPKASAEVNWVEGAHGVESIFTVIGLAIGAWWAYRNDWIKSAKDRKGDRELRKKEQEQREDTLNQRSRQLRWDQAKLAKEINDQFLDDHEAQQALAIVDADGDKCELTDAENKSIKHEFDRTKDEQITALRIDIKVTGKKEVFLRECFDAWFYWMSIMEQYLKNELILPEDIAYPSDYYLRELRKEKGLYDACIKYIAHYKLSPNILAFMSRFPFMPTIGEGSSAPVPGAASP